MSIRHATIKDLLKIPYHSIDRFKRNKDSVYCKANNKKCDAMVYGSLLMGLQEFGLWPRQSPDTINISVQELALQLYSLKVFAYPSNSNGYGTYQHHGCDQKVAFTGKIASSLSSIPNPVLEPQRRYMWIQGKK